MKRHARIHLKQNSKSQQKTNGLVSEVGASFSRSKQTQTKRCCAKKASTINRPLNRTDQFAYSFANDPQSNLASTTSPSTNLAINLPLPNQVPTSLSLRQLPDLSNLTSGSSPIVDSLPINQFPNQIVNQQAQQINQPTTNYDQYNITYLNAVQPSASFNDQNSVISQSSTAASQFVYASNQQNLNQNVQYTYDEPVRPSAINNTNVNNVLNMNNQLIDTNSINRTESSNNESGVDLLNYDDICLNYSNEHTYN